MGDTTGGDAGLDVGAVARRLGSRVLRQATLPPPIGFAVDVWGQSRAEWRSRKR